ncbi:MAG: integration host factor subunit beta [Paludibacteraceae bacterium]|nr:integration host factor subunit beta [Candidatus Physcocola equi]MCQ2234232.1 integration host factor subunit beta [Paludibacteraceae bacterium]
MTKAEIVDAIYKKTGIEKEEVLKVVEGYMEEVKSSLIKGDAVYLRGFGTFGLKVRKEKVARNISKGTAVIVPEHNIPHFKPCKEFMEEVAKAKK